MTGVKDHSEASETTSDLIDAGEEEKHRVQQYKEVKDEDRRRASSTGHDIPA
jgi:hypothetical protein